VAKADIGTGFGRLLRQHLIKAGALHLKGSAHARAEFVAEVKSGLFAIAGKGRAVLVLKTGAVDCVKHPRLGDKFHALGQQAFTDGEPREVGLLKHHNPVPILAQQGGGDGAGRACTNNGDIRCFDHDIHPVMIYILCGRELGFPRRAETAVE